MKWTFNELGIIPPLIWAEWIILVCILIQLAVLGWGLVELAKLVYKKMRGE